MRKKQSLAAHLHIAWLVNLLIAGLFAWFVVNGLLHWVSRVDAADIYRQPTPPPIVVVNPTPWAGTFPTPSSAPARQESPLPYVALGGALVLGAVFVLRLTENRRGVRV